MIGESWTLALSCEVFCSTMYRRISTDVAGWRAGESFPSTRPNFIDRCCLCWNHFCYKRTKLKSWFAFHFQTVFERNSGVSSPEFHSVVVTVWVWEPAGLYSDRQMELLEAALVPFGVSVTLTRLSSSSHSLWTYTSTPYCAVHCRDIQTWTVEEGSMFIQIFWSQMFGIVWTGGLSNCLQD